MAKQINWYLSYFQLTKSILPNAKVLIDPFHIVQHMNEAFNELRIREMNVLRKTRHKSAAEKLKKSWRILLKNRANINHYEYKTCEIIFPYSIRTIEA